MSNIEQYLHQLQKNLPRHLRAEAVAEVKTHLDELAREFQHGGLPRAQAEARAVAQFGSARNIGNRWRQAAGALDWGDIILAALPILGITGLGWTMVGRHLPLGLYLLMFGLGTLAAWRRSWPTWWYAWLGWLFLALMVVSGTQWVFLVTFPILVTLLAVDSWQHATLMTVPFTTYLAFATLIQREQLTTTGWGPGSIYPGNLIWLETGFSALWILILAASLRAARPSRRGVYLLAGLIGTQVMYAGAIVLMKGVAKMLPVYFSTTLTTQDILFHKLPIVLVTLLLTVYPLFVWLAVRKIRQPNRHRGLSV